MTDVATSIGAAAQTPPRAVASPHMTDAAKARLRRRYRAEQRFKMYGVAAIAVAVLSLVVLLGDIVWRARGALIQTQVRLEVELDPQALGIQTAGGTPTPAEIRSGSFERVVVQALSAALPEVTNRSDRRLLQRMVSEGAGAELRNKVVADPSLLGRTIEFWAPTRSDIDLLVKGQIDRGVPEDQRRVRDIEIQWIEKLDAQGKVRSAFNTRFFAGSNSSNPEQAGVWGAIIGSLLTLSVTAFLAVPIGVMAAIYLQEFAPKNRLTELIEVNINNLAAVPSIVFGLLGLAVLLNFMGLPRSAPLVGGIVLALMSLPVIIIATRASLRSVPPSIREAALGIGASKMQVVLHHVLPLAVPGIMTGTIIAMAHALGETAPLLMIGMNAFFTDVPSGWMSSATVLPVQVFTWAEDAQRGFVEKTSLAICVLLLFLLSMNAIAIYLRRKFERRW